MISLAAGGFCGMGEKPGLRHPRGCGEVGAMTPGATGSSWRSEIKIGGGNYLPNSCHAAMGCLLEVVVYPLAKTCDGARLAACRVWAARPYAVDSGRGKERYAIFAQARGYFHSSLPSPT
jgi:hypothetical protein